MMRAFHAVTVIVILACTSHSSAQPPSTTSNSQTVLEEAERLDQQAVKLDGEGQYGAAIAPAERALELREKALGPTHPLVAQSLNTLARLYLAQGEYGKAEPLLVRALDIREKALGPNHPEVAQSLNNLAELYRTQGAYAKAEPLYARSLAIREKVLGPSHPEVARSLNSLAELYQGQGAYAKAEPLLVRALDIYEKALGPNHPQVAQSLANLAELYRAQGTNGKAEPLFARSLAIREKTLGPSHPDVASNLNNLATMSQAQGANSQAESLLAREADIRERQLSSELTRLSEARKRALMTLVQGETYRLVSFHADTAANSATALDLAFTTILRRKGRILDSQLDSEMSLRAHLTPPLQALVDQLSHARAKLAAQLYAHASTPSATAAQRDAIAALRGHIDELETALSVASEGVGTQVAPVTAATVQAALPADAALVEFVRYDRFDPQQAQQPWQAARYVAYLLTRQGPRRWVALGEAAPIDAAVDTVLAAMDSRIPVATARAALQRLDALAFAPIRAKLSGVSHVILAPDGKLNLVPFEALVDGEGHYALERYLVSYVSSSRDLLRLATPQQPRSAAVIIAAPDYGPRPSPASKSRLWFAPLAGADAEAQDLRGYFPTAPVTGAKATKAALATLTGPAIVHIVTQGFYGWPTGLAGATGSSAGAAASRGPSQASVGTGSVPAPPPDPAEGMDQSGLAMAGANRGPEGILTARELAGFDWWGTQLVVLSASQSGVGAVSPGDGVYGLRRALVLAGTASQVVSLWNIADAPTRALMRDFYAELKQGTGRAEALRRAKRHLLQQPAYAHPFCWAAFIPAGDWRPLDATAFLPRPTH
jgi:CHAT domain-containing protein/tetratricopeptide (TPR) repeat protein